MKAEHVYKSVRIFTWNHDHKFENVYVHDWEADLFSVTATPYSYEIEVKVSRSDFFADFKKVKHELFKTYKSMPPLTHKQAPNKYMFACPVGLISLTEVPEYAGLIYVMDNGEARLMKKAPFLHKDIFNIREMLFMKYYNQAINQREEIRELKSKIESLSYQVK